MDASWEPAIALGLLFLVVQSAGLALLWMGRERRVRRWGLAGLAIGLVAWCGMLALAAPTTEAAAVAKSEPSPEPVASTVPQISHAAAAICLSGAILVGAWTVVGSGVWASRLVGASIATLAASALLFMLHQPMHAGMLAVLGGVGLIAMAHQPIGSQPVRRDRLQASLALVLATLLALGGSTLLLPGPPPTPAIVDWAATEPADEVTLAVAGQDTSASASLALLASPIGLAAGTVLLGLLMLRFLAQPPLERISWQT